MELSTLFLMTSLSLGLPQGLLDAICRVESNHRPLAVNPYDGGSASVGICQVKESTKRFVGVQGDLMDPRVNIRAAGAYLAYQLKRYHGNVKQAVTAYNQGTCYRDGNSKYYRKVATHWRRAGHKERCAYPRGRR